MSYHVVECCRLCGCKDVKKILDLGLQALTGVFPTKDEVTQKLPLTLSKCQSCELVQLYHDFDVEQLYGETYGYRSGLNTSMVNHLNNISKRLSSMVNLSENGAILDIGSNDGTLLNCFEERKDVLFVGVDPSAEKFKKYYNNDINIISSFFSRDLVVKFNKKFKIVSTIAMFYDLPNPIKFVQDIYDVLDDDGIWFTEQSYCISMIKATSFDTICQEHIEYYCLKQLKYICDAVGLKIIEISFNDVNGGSFITIATKRNNLNYDECLYKINKILNDENQFWDTNPFDLLMKNVELTKNKIFKLFDDISNNGKVVHGLGASTKGNVLLQYFDITDKILKCISDVNEYKFGRYTPGTHIPIISDIVSRGQHPDYYFVLPWHFKENIIQKELEYLKNGGKLIFPLPQLEIVSYGNGDIIREKI